MSKCKFKVGDIVIGNSSSYYDTNKGWIGEVLHIHFDGNFAARGRSRRGDIVNFVDLDPKDFDLYTKNQPDKIVITTDGKTTTAKMYRDKSVVKVETTKCHPDDRFDFMVGAKIAFNRLVGTPTGEEKKEPETLKYKIGDKVIIGSTNIDKIDSKFRGSVGEIIAVDPTYRYPYLVRNHMSPKAEELWSTVSGYAPKYYNGKVVCVENKTVPDHLIIGKIYTFVDGQCGNEIGGNIVATPVTNFADLVSRFGDRVKFLEVVE